MLRLEIPATSTQPEREDVQALGQDISRELGQFADVQFNYPRAREVQIFVPPAESTDRAPSTQGPTMATGVALVRAHQIVTEGQLVRLLETCNEHLATFELWVNGVPIPKDEAEFASRAIDHIAARVKLVNVEEPAASEGLSGVRYEMKSLIPPKSPADRESVAQLLANHLDEAVRYERSLDEVHAARPSVESFDQRCQVQMELPAEDAAQVQLSETVRLLQADLPEGSWTTVVQKPESIDTEPGKDSHARVSITSPSIDFAFEQVTAIIGLLPVDSVLECQFNGAQLTARRDTSASEFTERYLSAFHLEDGKERITLIPAQDHLSESGLQAAISVARHFSVPVDVLKPQEGPETVEYTAEPTSSVGSLLKALGMYS